MMLQCLAAFPTRGPLLPRLEQHQPFRQITLRQNRVPGPFQLLEQRRARQRGEFCEPLAYFDPLSFWSINLGNALFAPLLQNYQGRRCKFEKWCCRGPALFFRALRQFEIATIVARDRDQCLEEYLPILVAGLTAFNQPFDIVAYLADSVPLFDQRLGLVECSAQYGRILDRLAAQRLLELTEQPPRATPSTTKKQVTQRARDRRARFYTPFTS